MAQPASKRLVTEANITDPNSVAGAVVVATANSAVNAVVDGKVDAAVAGQMSEINTAVEAARESEEAAAGSASTATEQAGIATAAALSAGGGGVAVLFGDSWTQTENYALRDALSAALGMPVISYGIGGAKFIARPDAASFWNELDAAVADASVNPRSVRHVIFVGGMNNWAWNSGANSSEATAIFAQLRDMYPGASRHYYASLPYRWRDGNCYRAGWEYFRAYQTAAAAAGFSAPHWPYSWSHGSLVANATDWRYPGNTLWFGGGAGDWLNSYVHPTAAGFQLFGRLIAQDIAGNQETQHTTKMLVSGTGISTFLQVGTGLQYSYLTGLVKQSGNRFTVRALLDFQLDAAKTIPAYFLRINQSIAPRVFFESGSAFSQYLPVSLIKLSDNTTIPTIAQLALTVVPEADQSNVNNFYVDVKLPNLPSSVEGTPTQYRLVLNLELDRL